MKKLAVVLFIIFLAGCMRVRTYTIEEPRRDTGIKGNQGYLAGEPEEEGKESKLGPTRKISVLEFEFGPKSEKPAEAPPARQEEVYEEKNYQEEGSSEVSASESSRREYKIPSPELEYKNYTVQENDTLQKISLKFYDTTRKWELIYQENKDILKSPDRIYPGTVIKIPQL